MSRVDNTTNTNSPEMSRTTIGNIAYSLVVLEHLDQRVHFLLNAWLPNQKLMIDAQMI